MHFFSQLTATSTVVSSNFWNSIKWQTVKNLHELSNVFCGVCLCICTCWLNQKKSWRRAITASPAKPQQAVNASNPSGSRIWTRKTTIQKSARISFRVGQTAFISSVSCFSDPIAILLMVTRESTKKYQMKMFLNLRSCTNEPINGDDEWGSDWSLLTGSYWYYLINSAARPKPKSMPL